MFMQRTLGNQRAVNITGQDGHYEAIKKRLYPEVIKKIRNEIRGQKIFVSLTFSQFNSERQISDDVLANIIVGPLKSTKTVVNKSCFLVKSISIKSYQNYNKEFLCKLFNDSMNLLWSNNVAAHAADILLFITEESDAIIDGTVEELRSQYPQMIYLPCVSRLLRHMKEHIRFTYSCADELYAAMRPLVWNIEPESRTFFKQTKLPMGIYRFMEFSFLAAENFDSVKLFFDPRSKEKFNLIKELFTDPKVKEEIEEIKRKYTKLVNVRKIIRKIPKAELVESIEAIEEFRQILEDIANSPNATKDDEDLLNILNQLLKENAGYAKMRAISQVLSGAEKALPDCLSSLSKSDIQLFRYAPIGAINRKWCFPGLYEASDFGEGSCPVKYIDYLSVVKCYGQSDDYLQFYKKHFQLYQSSVIESSDSDSDEDDRSEVDSSEDSEDEDNYYNFSNVVD